MDFQKLANIDLIGGKGGGDPRNGLCIMEMVDYFAGNERVTDQPACACPVLARFAIGLNDRAPSQEDRNGLKPLLPLLTGSRDPESEKRRAEYIVFQVARRIVAPLFDKRWPKHARAIREAQTLAALRDACRNARAAAYAAAYADAYAAYAAAAAAAAADAAYAAYAAAAAAAAAAADAYAYADAERQAWLEGRAILEEAIRLGKTGELDPLYVVIREHALMERVRA